MTTPAKDPTTRAPASGRNEFATLGIGGTFAALLGGVVAANAPVIAGLDIAQLEFVVIGLVTGLIALGASKARSAGWLP